MVKKSFIKFSMLAMSAVLVVGCTTTDAYTGETKTSSTAFGAGLGALGGAIIGVLAGDNAKERRKGALIGAGLGALGGAGVGNYMDKQEAMLRTQLANSGVSITRVGNDIILNMPGNITFDTNNIAIKPQFFDVLNSVSIVLAKFDKTLIDITGHTDSTGSEELNQNLSLRRAQSVSMYLQGQKIMAQRMIVRGAGETLPVANNGTKEGRAANRRVEIQISPFQG